VSQTTRRVLVTGANGFIGKNLVTRLEETSGFTIIRFTREDDASSLVNLVALVDIVIHLAGENRPKNESAFLEVNTRLTEVLCDAIRAEYNKNGRKVKLIFASSTQAKLDNPYGVSKLAAEALVKDLASAMDDAALIFRLPGVFGKWCRPHYNSVVATFCHNIARDLPTYVSDPSTSLKLVYIDDVVSKLIDIISTPSAVSHETRVEPEYTITLGELYDTIHSFRSSRETLMTDRCGTGLLRALYATYISYLPKEKFSYCLPQHRDRRGIFVEFLKTRDSGQFSFFTALPGVARGGHYHHTKSEKFLVVKGEALFRFRNLITEEMAELHITSDNLMVVDTIPGWSHDITNIGEDEMIVMLWANENFDRDRPDTIMSKI